MAKIMKEAVNVPDPATLAEMGIPLVIEKPEVKMVELTVSASPLVPYKPGTMFMIGSVEFGSQEEMLKWTLSTAALLKDIMEKQRMFTTFNDKKGGVHVHPNLEAWQTLAMLVGCTLREVKSQFDQMLNGFESRVEVIRLIDGMKISEASGFCDCSENGKSAFYAAKSMSITRATAKAVKTPFGFIMKISGFEPTPAAEMEDENGEATIPGFTKPDQPRATLMPRPDPVEESMNEILTYGLALKLTAEELNDIFTSTFGKNMPDVVDAKEIYKATLHLFVREGRPPTKEEVAKYMFESDPAKIKIEK